MVTLPGDKGSRVHKSFGLDALSKVAQRVFSSANALRTDTPQTFEDTSFVVGDSPATLDANAALGRDATEFTVLNDGAGNFTVSVSSDGVAFGDEHTVQNGETYSIDRIQVDSIRITHVADSSYRVIVL